MFGSKRNRVWLAGALLVIAGTSLVMANKATDGDGLCITISPNTLSLNRGNNVISVHSNIPFSIVSRDTLVLIPDSEAFTIARIWSFADDCGDLVVKAELKLVSLPGDNLTLTLKGQLTGGRALEASDTVAIKP
ncbi:MAG: hypothetical protein K9N55_02235 [Phycisphaerae bacterium]|nr:hypothetical protein [Phycisphaerae bacterium]